MFLALQIPFTGTLRCVCVTHTSVETSASRSRATGLRHANVKRSSHYQSAKHLAREMLRFTQFLNACGLEILEKGFHKCSTASMLMAEDNGEVTVQCYYEIDARRRLCRKKNKIA